MQIRIKQVTELLLQFPQAGTRTSDPLIRRIATVPYPYVIFYEVADRDVIIHAVRHGAGDPSAMPGSGGRG